MKLAARKAAEIACLVASQTDGSLSKAVDLGMVGGVLGTVVVGFTIDADGGRSGVKVLPVSGTAALDQIALDHIRRAAPFPAPPAEAGRNHSSEFLGK